MFSSKLTKELIANPPNIPSSPDTILTVLKTFGEKRSTSWAVFKAVWQDLILSETCSAVQKDALARMRQLYQYCRQAIMARESSRFVVIGAMFAFFVLHETQLCEPKEPISVDCQLLTRLKALRAEWAHIDDCKDVRNIDRLMRERLLYSYRTQGSTGTPQLHVERKRDLQRLASKVPTRCRIEKEFKLNELQTTAAAYLKSRKRVLQTCGELLSGGVSQTAPLSHVSEKLEADLTGILKTHSRRRARDLAHQAQIYAGELKETTKKSKRKR